jgi:hypothetical protein
LRAESAFQGLYPVAEFLIAVLGGRELGLQAFDGYVVRRQSFLRWLPLTESDDDTARLRVVPTRALLHRNADPGTLRSPKDYLHDCVVFSEPQTFV